MQALVVIFTVFVILVSVIAITIVLQDIIAERKALKKAENVVKQDDSNKPKE